MGTSQASQILLRHFGTKFRSLKHAPKLSTSGYVVEGIKTKLPITLLRQIDACGGRNLNLRMLRAQASAPTGDTRGTFLTAAQVRNSGAYFNSVARLCYERNAGCCFMHACDLAWAVTRGGLLGCPCHAPCTKLIPQKLTRTCPQAAVHMHSYKSGPW